MGQSSTGTQELVLSLITVLPGHSQPVKHSCTTRQLKSRRLLQVKLWLHGHDDAQVLHSCPVIGQSVTMVARINS